MPNIEISNINIGDIVKLHTDVFQSLGRAESQGDHCLVLRIISAKKLIHLCKIDHDNQIDSDFQLSVSPDQIVSVSGSLPKDQLEVFLRKVTKDFAEAHFSVKHARGDEFSEGNAIPYAGRVFDKTEVTSLVDSALDFWLTAGRFTDQFEKKLSRTLQVRHSLLVNSGSSANLVAFMSLTSPSLGERRIKKGDEVITVAAGFPATITPIIQFGAIPVFVDIVLPFYNINITQLEEARSDKTKAVMVAHTLGNPFDLQAVKDFCDKYNLWLIEDNCDALGSEYFYNNKWVLTGSVGDFGTSSFYPPHHITMGEGGAVYTNTPKLNRIAASFRDWGRDCWCAGGKDNTCGKRFEWQLGDLPCGYDHKYIYSHFGYNLKATDMQAAIGVSQLDKLPIFTKKRQQNWERLRLALSDLEDDLILPEPSPNSRPSWFGFLITIRDSSSLKRDRILSALEKNGIQTRMLFAGNYLRQPCCAELKQLPGTHRVVGDLAITDLVMNQTFWIGVYPGLTDPMLDFMATKIHEVVREKKSSDI